MNSLIIIIIDSGSYFELDFIQIRHIKTFVYYMMQYCRNYWTIKTLLLLLISYVKEIVYIINEITRMELLKITLPYNS